MARIVKLGVNIDHVATIRNARGGSHPEILRAAQIVKRYGGDSITIHLREDRRHITDADLFELKEKVKLPINLEIAATDEMLEIACKAKPEAVCIVPEKREEITTEGGLDVIGNFENLKRITTELKNNGIRVSFFIDPDLTQVEAAKNAGAEVVEFHTGKYCRAEGEARQAELAKIDLAAMSADFHGLIVHAGHGLTYETVPAIVKIAQVVELNIGHFIIGEAIFDGLGNAIHKMIKVIKNSN